MALSCCKPAPIAAADASQRITDALIQQKDANNCARSMQNLIDRQWIARSERNVGGYRQDHGYPTNRSRAIGYNIEVRIQAWDGKCAVRKHGYWLVYIATQNVQHVHVRAMPCRWRRNMKYLLLCSLQ